MAAEMNYAGGCRCGAIRYAIAAPSLPRAYACHCLDCQTWSGSAFSVQFPLPEDALNVSGEPAIFDLTTPSGNLSRQRVCGACHTRVYNTNSSRSGIVMIRAGTLDRSSDLDVTAHIWTKSKQAWLTIPPDVPSWPEAAPIPDLVKALQP